MDPPPKQLIEHDQKPFAPALAPHQPSPTPTPPPGRRPRFAEQGPAGVGGGIVGEGDVLLGTRRHDRGYPLAQDLRGSWPKVATSYPPNAGSRLTLRSPPRSLGVSSPAGIRSRQTPHFVSTSKSTAPAPSRLQSIHFFEDGVAGSRKPFFQGGSAHVAPSTRASSWRCLPGANAMWSRLSGRLM